ncbi:MAG: hypothetical protein QHJ82_15090, partial [Verrucomicrobiota bacterium]|nr:hypothetical protein [Verrucomicrobiota bacterium]
MSGKNSSEFAFPTCWLKIREEKDIDEELEKAGWACLPRFASRRQVAEHVCAQVTHRQFVFTISKRLRIYFRFDRRLLGDPAGAHVRQPKLAPEPTHLLFSYPGQEQGV